MPLCHPAARLGVTQAEELETWHCGCWCRFGWLELHYIRTPVARDTEDGLSGRAWSPHRANMREA